MLDLCESMPPEAFKAFLQRISAALPPSVHRALVARYGGVLMGGFGTGAVNRFLSRRLAKKAVALWLQRTESQELREVRSFAKPTTTNQATQPTDRPLSLLLTTVFQISLRGGTSLAADRVGGVYGPP